jgi:hypothetical protein
MKPSTRIGADPTFCKLCGDRYWSWGAHAERCTGEGPRWIGAAFVPDGTPEPPPGTTLIGGYRTDERPCECPPGFQHQPDCHIVVGQKP